MNWGPIRSVWGKELRDTVRDRRTLVVMVLLPVVMSPLLIVGSTLLLKSQADAARRATKKCGLLGVSEVPELEAQLRALKKFEFVTVADEREAEEKVRQGELQVAVEVPAGTARALANGEQATIGVYFKGTVIQSQTAMLAVSQKIEEYAKDIVKRRLAAKGIPETAIEPLKSEPKNVVQEEMGGFVLGFIVPMLIVVWSIVGGMYTAIDVSAGEKERNTLEALMLTPASRLEVTLGKLAAVSTVGFFTMVAALGSMYAALSFVTIPLRGANGTADGSPDMHFHISPLAIVLMLGLSVLLVIAFSSLMVGLGIFARSVKEAQTLITPLYLLALLPVMVASILDSEHPSIELFLIPGVNAVMLFKELLKNQFEASHILATAAALGACVAAAIAFTLATFRRETVLFKS